MTLKGLYLKNGYDSDEDDILGTFYIPVLSESIKYYRLAGFFRSTALAASAKGIQGLLKNNGEMKLVVSAAFSEQDRNAIKEGIENPENIIARNFIKDLNSIEDEFTKDHIGALSWMIAQKKLEIRIAIVYDKDGAPIAIEDWGEKGIFHQKIGIFEDKEGNRISFNGSVNESLTAWLENIEDFDVFRDWVEEEKNHFERHLRRFKKFWEGKAKRTEIIDLPTAIKEELIKIAPNDFTQLNFDRWKNKKKFEDKKKTLRPYQQEAIDNWLKHDKKGIFEMATGTGKTIAALGCIQKVEAEHSQLVTIIASPFNHLSVQWKREIEDFGFNNEILLADSSNSKWKNQLADFLLDISNGIKDKLIILTTHDTLSGTDFIKIMGLSEINSLLIVDEVHGIGAPIRKNGLLNNYQFRLGLSATPRRWLDDEGTEDIFNYFGDVVYEFSLKKAINTINPENGQTYLTPYEYIPIFVDLSDNELDEYDEITKKIARSFYQTKDKKEQQEWFNILCIKRQKIIVDAVNKIRKLSEILDEIPEIKYCLIYTSPHQLNDVQTLLNNKGIIQHKFTLNEGTKKEEKYGNISEREFLLKNFANGNYQALVAIKCLDEGVDVPPARIAVIMASSGNSRQYIQRRGRILRNYPGKEKSTIYDLIVIPPISKEGSETWELERKIIEKELKRYKEFAYLSLNRMECLGKIEKIEEKYKIFVTVDW